MSEVDDDYFKDIDLPENHLPESQIINYKDWRRFVDRQFATPPGLVSLSQYRTMSDDEKVEFNDKRRRYHSSFGPIDTKSLSSIHNEVMQLAAMNYSAPPGARPGVALDGNGSTGKSTIVTHLGRKYERALRKKKRLPGELPNGDLFLPVVYVLVNAQVTVKSFDRILAKFYNLPIPKRYSDAEIAESVIEAARRCGTSMVIIDEVHFVQPEKVQGSLVNNHFKSLANKISATFVYAGVNIKQTGLFREGKSTAEGSGTQTQSRFARYELGNLARGDKDFSDLVNTIVLRHLLLLKERKGLLNRDGVVSSSMLDYIHDRTGGLIGPIAQLLRVAANNAIACGEEEITREAMDKIRLPESAEMHRDAVTRKA